MAGLFSFEETPESRSQEYGSTDRIGLQYCASGEQDDAIVREYAEAHSPLTVNGLTGMLYRRDIRLHPNGFNVYTVDVEYTRPETTSTALPVGSRSFMFDTTGAAVNIKCAREHIGSYTAKGRDSDANHEGAINVREGDVEGTDIVIPGLKLSYTFKHPKGVVTEAYARKVAGATGTTNLRPYRGFEVGEFLFIGATGSDGTDADAEVTYHFIASQNATLKISDISNIVKDGHWYVWIEFEDEVRVGRAVKLPHRVNVERLYEPIDFKEVLGWS